MPYDIGTRMDYLGRRMKSLNQNVLYYSRPNLTPPRFIEIENFTPEKLDVTQLAAYGIVLVTDKALDVVFDYDLLSANLNPPLPIQGDQLLWAPKIYEILSIGDETFRFTTTTRKRIRVHIKQISKETEVGILSLDINGKFRSYSTEVALPVGIP